MATTLATYEICIQEPLEPYWNEWFDDLHLSVNQEGNTLLTGTHIDQVALHSTLTKIHHLGLTLLSVQRIEHATMQR